jgi:hypothetical protein
MLGRGDRDTQTSPLSPGGICQRAPLAGTCSTKPNRDAARGYPASDEAAAERQPILLGCGLVTARSAVVMTVLAGSTGDTTHRPRALAP